MPVIVAIGSDGNIGHAVIVDGYGYEKGNPSRILYHVLMGNEGDPAQIAADRLHGDAEGAREGGDISAAGLAGQ